MTLHTSDGCSFPSQQGVQTASQVQGNCFGTQGCQMADPNQNSFGDGFNNGGGGVYAMEWTSDFIKVWFWASANIPTDIKNNTPDPTTWPEPVSFFINGQGCTIDDHFQNHQVVFDTTFCGDWAGSTDSWNSYPTCKAAAGSCQDYVANNPTAFQNSYWDVSSVRVFQAV
jgi:hypothetical protein